MQPVGITAISDLEVQFTQPSLTERILNVMAKNDAIENKYILREDIICKIFTERPIFKSMIYFFLKKRKKEKRC